jgi:dipeptidyl aminopeptidase/acylaminoacyl peptidase
MTKLRLGFLISSFLVTVIFGTLAYLYANGYRFNKESLSFKPNGLLVANSDPTGAQIYINGELKSATNTTIPLTPATIDVELKKDGFLPWRKRLTIEKEIVTEIDVTLFPTAPSLSAITFGGAFKPSISPDLTKIIYGVTSENPDRAGLWILETVNLPLGFNREARRLVDGNLENASWEFSPDGQSVLLTTQNGLFLINTNQFTPQSQLVNVSSQKSKIIQDWKDKASKKLESQLASLPVDLSSILSVKATNIKFSPDESKILYEASGPATIRENLIRALPGASTQRQERHIEKGKKYVYDIKEDRNFEVGNSDDIIYWFPTSRNLVIPEKDKITIMDYDGTNRQIVYSGSYIYPNAYPTASSGRLYILTNLGSLNSVPNLYSLSLK